MKFEDKSMSSPVSALSCAVAKSVWPTSHALVVRFSSSGQPASARPKRPFVFPIIFSALAMSTDLICRNFKINLPWGYCSVKV